MKLTPAVKKEIEYRNKLWKKSTPKQKRVLIAKDVIEQLNSCKMEASSGTWINIYDSVTVASHHYRYFGEKLGRVGLRECILSEKETTCRVCGIGSLMVSAILFKNTMTVSDYEKQKLDYIMIDREHVGDKLRIRKIFTTAQLKLIEIAFEMGGGYYTRLVSKEQERAVKFGKQCINEHDRLIAIMENIIENDGTFKP